MATTVTITSTDQGVFVDATCDGDQDVSITEALGMCELGKALLIEQARSG